MELNIEMIGIDSWCRPIYKNIDNGRLYVDIDLGRNEIPNLYTVSKMYGEPDCPLRDDIKINIIE